MSNYTSEEQKKTSVEFMSVLNNMLDMIEEISDVIKDNQYLNLMNQLRDLHQFKEKLESTVVYQIHHRRALSTVRNTPPQMTRDEKLKDPDYRLCDRCDEIVHKTSFSRHRQSKRCLTILQKKQLSVSSRSTVLDQTKLIKLENKDEKFLFERHESEKKLMDSDEKKE